VIDMTYSEERIREIKAEGRATIKRVDEKLGIEPAVRIPARSWREANAAAYAARAARWKAEDEAAEKAKQRAKEEQRKQKIAQAHAAENPLLIATNARHDKLEASTEDLAIATRRMADAFEDRIDALSAQVSRLEAELAETRKAVN
jgi:hypothetical protein